MSAGGETAFPAERGGKKVRGRRSDHEERYRRRRPGVRREGEAWRIRTTWEIAAQEILRAAQKRMRGETPLVRRDGAPGRQEPRGGRRLCGGCGHRGGRGGDARLPHRFSAWRMRPLAARTVRPAARLAV